MCDHFPIPDERVTQPTPPATRPIVVTVGYHCAVCGETCERKEPT